MAVGTTLYAATYGSSIWKYAAYPLEAEDNSRNETLAESLNFSCYPNPVRNSLTIDRTSLHFNDNNPVEYTISNLTGEKLMEFEQNAALFTIPVGGLGSGAYFLTAMQGANRATTMVTVVE